MHGPGKNVVERLASGVIRDDIKGRVRQMVKAGGREQMRRDFNEALKGFADVKEVVTPRGTVRVAELDDGTKISARGFSSGGQPSIQVDNPEFEQIVKVRYE